LEEFFFEIPIISKTISKNRLEIDFLNRIIEIRGFQDSSPVPFRVRFLFVNSMTELFFRCGFANSAGNELYFYIGSLV